MRHARSADMGGPLYLSMRNRECAELNVLRIVLVADQYEK